MKATYKNDASAKLTGRHDRTYRFLCLAVSTSPLHSEVLVLTQHSSERIDNQSVSVHGLPPSFTTKDGGGVNYYFNGE